MNKILWFAESGGTKSFARVTDSLVPLLIDRYDITLLSNNSINGAKFVKLGSDSEFMSFKDFSKEIKNDSNLLLQMKYILLQIVDLIYNNDFDYLLIMNGIYELDWISKMLTSSENFLTNKQGKKTKLIIYAPIDYIPSPRIVENILKADKFITTNSVMANEVSNLANKQIDWIGHGINKKYAIHTREKLCDLVSTQLKGKVFFKSNLKNENDIIILNANVGIRKRLDITVKAFIEINKIYPNTKLWLHTNLKSLFDLLAKENISIAEISNNIILSTNELTEEELSWVYQLSDISLQTSTGEGWSLTNMESAVYSSLQVVPDFLACGYHFKNRGILIPVTEKTSKNEDNIDIIIGEVSIKDTIESLKEAIGLINQSKHIPLLQKAYDYSIEHTWSKVADQFDNVFND